MGKKAGLPYSTGKLPPAPPQRIRGSRVLDSRALLGSPLRDPPVQPGPGAAQRWWHGALCAALTGTHPLQIHPDPLPNPICLCSSWWSCTSTETSELTGSPDPDYNALWTLQARLKYLGGSVWLTGCIFQHSCHRKVLGVVRRTPVSLYFTIWCCNCFVRE